MTKTLSIIVSIACLLLVASAVQAEEPAPPTDMTERGAVVEPSEAATVPEDGQASTEATVESETTDATCAQEEEASYLGFPTIKPNCSAIGPCSQWNSNYCSYRCVGFNCCEGTVLIPGSYCPMICA